MRVGEMIRVLHRWVGLSAAVFLIIIAVTGSLLVYREALTRWLYPRVTVIAPPTTRLPLDTLVARAARASGADLVQVYLPRRDDAPVQVQVGGNRLIAVHPGTGDTLGTRILGRGVLSQLGGLHATLAGGRLGGILVGVLGIILLFELVTGLIRWWPSKVWTVRRHVPFKRMTFEWHNMSGVWGLVLLFLNTATGVLISFGVLVDRALQKVDPAPPAPRVSVETREAPFAPLDSILAAAGRAHGGTPIRMILPLRPDRPVSVWHTWAGSHSMEGTVRVLVDPYDARVLAVAAGAAEGSFRQRFAEARIGIHSGEIAGGPGRVLTFLLGPILVLQALTGATYWWLARGRKATGA